MNIHKMAAMTACLLLSSYSDAQKPVLKKPLYVGATVPEVRLANMLYYPAKNVRLSDFRGKLVILDFWSSWCGACIHLMPHMDSLQRKFGNQVQIILVNQKSRKFGDNEKKIRSVISRVNELTGRKMNLPVVFNAADLDEYFPARMLPHEVWINRQGQVEAITSAIEVTEKNISDYLKNGNIVLHTKQDDFKYDAHQPLFVNGNGGSGDDFKFRAILTGYREGISRFSQQTNPANPAQIVERSFNNVSLTTLLDIAYREKMASVFANRRIYEVKDSEFFKDHESDSLKYRYTYCYDLIVKPTTPENFDRFMQQDMERFFGVTVRNEKRKIPCYILELADEANRPVSKFLSKEEESEDNSVIKYLRYFKLSEAHSFFDLRLDKPLINQTGLPDELRLDINLPFNLKDSKEMCLALTKAGFKIHEEERELNVVVITDK